MHVTYMAVARSFSGGVATHYVLPVFWMTSCNLYFHIMLHTLPRGWLRTAASRDHGRVKVVHLCGVTGVKTAEHKIIHGSYGHSIFSLTSGSAMAEGPRDALVSRNSATTKYPYRMALFA